MTQLLSLFITHLVFHSILHGIFIEHLLCVRHHGRYKDIANVKEDEAPALAELPFCEETDN